MTRSTPFSTHALLLVLAAVLSLPIATSALAQDADRKAERTERFAEALDLTDAQQRILTDAEAEPGGLWSVAAALAPTLSDAQKERLFARPERPGRMQRDGKERRAARGARHQHGGRAERREASHAAMRSALNLTDDQVAKLDALRESRKAAREARRAARQEQRMQGPASGALPAELASILTPDQQEVFEVHRALAMRMHHGRRHGRHGTSRR